MLGLGLEASFAPYFFLLAAILFTLRSSSSILRTSGRGTDGLVLACR